MIGKPLRTRLLADAAVSALIADRMSPIKFSEGDILPCLMYATDSMEPLPCRSGNNQYQGTAELSLLASRYVEIEDLITAIRAVLDNFSGIVEVRSEEGVLIARWSLNIEAGIEGPDDEDPDLKAYFKRLDFYVFAQKL